MKVFKKICADISANIKNIYILEKIIIIMEECLKTIIEYIKEKEHFLHNCNYSFFQDLIVFDEECTYFSKRIIDILEYNFMLEYLLNRKGYTFSEIDIRTLKIINYEKDEIGYYQKINKKIKYIIDYLFGYYNNVYYRVSLSDNCFLFFFLNNNKLTKYCISQSILDFNYEQFISYLKKNFST